MKLRLQMTHLSPLTTRMIKKKKVEEEEERDLLSRKANSKTEAVSGEEETPQPLSCNSLELTNVVAKSFRVSKRVVVVVVLLLLLPLPRKEKTMILKEGSSKSSSSNPQHIKQIRVRLLLP